MHSYCLSEMYICFCICPQISLSELYLYMFYINYIFMLRWFFIGDNVDTVIAQKAVKEPKIYKITKQ